MTPLAETLRRLLDADVATVSDDPGTLATHGGDKWFASHAPEVVVFARSTADVSRLLRFCLGEWRPRHGPRRGLRLRRGRGADAWGRRVVPGSHDAGPGAERAGFRRRRPARRHHGRTPGGGAGTGAVLPARPGQPETLVARWQHRHQRRRAEVSEIRRHAALRPRSGGRAGERGRGALRRADAQEQDRVRPRRPVRRLRGDARRGHGGDVAAAAVTPGAGSAVVRVCGHPGGGGGGAGRVRGGLAAGGVGDRGPVHAGGGAGARRRGEGAGGRGAPVVGAGTGGKPRCAGRSRNCAGCCSASAGSSPRRR